MRDRAGERLDARDGRAWLRCARRGDFAAAWRVSDRIAARGEPPPVDRTPRHLQRIWNGSPLLGRRVLVRCYHGLGDTIQFARHLPQLREQACEVIVWAQPKLLPLIATVRGVDRVAPLHDGAPDVDYDVDVEIMELPYVFRTSLDTIPIDVPYVQAAPAAVPLAPPRIGLVWRGGDWDERRSIPFPLLFGLLDRPGISWCSLQHDPLPGECHPQLHEIGCTALPHVAAVMRSLDLVITIDSVTAHLAGALAVPVWTLLPKPADWRWLIDRDDSPWYPTMRLFRQRRRDDWRPVLADVADALSLPLKQSAAERHQANGRTTTHTAER